MKGIDDWAARHDKVQAIGDEILNVHYLNLVHLAGIAKQQGGDITDQDSDWSKAYIAAAEANRALKRAAYNVGFQISADKPPQAGPMFFLT